MAIEYGLTPSGFVVKPFNVILEEQKELYRQKFGSDIDLSPESVAGAVCYNEAIKLTQIWEMLGGLYTCHDINSATSVHLDRLGNQVNVQRQSATSTEVQCVLWGDNGTVIPQGHLIEDDNENYFKLDEEITLNQGMFCGLALNIKKTDADTLYNFTISGNTITYRVPTEEPLPSKSEIIENIEGLINYAMPDIFNFISDEDNVKFYSKDLKNNWNINITTTDSIEVDEVGNIGKYIAEKKGSVYVGVGTLTTIVNEISGLDSVYNYVEGNTGSDTETDDWFRLSIKTKQKQAIATETAIENAVYLVPNVSYCRCFSNRTSSYVGNVPPKAIQVIVQGGDDEAIARAIFNSQPAGIEAYGTTVVSVPDSNGYVWRIGFSRPVTKYLWMIVEYGIYEEEETPEDVNGSIINNIVEWSRNNFRIGDDVIYQRFYQPVYQVSGIGSVDIKIALSNSPSNPPDISAYKSENIPIAQNEIVSVDPSRIFVGRVSS